MYAFWQKPVFWVVFFIILIAILIPLTLFLFKGPILSLIPSKTAPKPGKCLIVEDKYCSRAELISQKVPLGTAIDIVIRVPVGKPIFSPIDGQITKTQLDEKVIFYKGFRATLFDPANRKIHYIITGDIKFIDMLTKNMKKGDIIGYTQDTGIDMMGYNFTFYVADIGADNRESADIELMHKLFPSINFK